MKCPNGATLEIDCSVVEIKVFLVSFFGWVVSHRVPSRIYERLKDLHLSSGEHNMGRSQLKLVASGGEVFWVQCPCGFRWSGSSESAKKLAYKLHGRKCQEMRGVQPMNTEGPGIVRYKENAPISAQRILTKARAEELTLY